MRPFNKPLLAAVLLFTFLAASFLWCIIDNLWHSAQAAQSGDIMIATSDTVRGGFFWLISHGIHGAAVIALPALLLRRFTPQHHSFA